MSAPPLRNYRTVLYWRPLIPGLNDSDEHLATAFELGQHADATVFTGLFYRDEIADYYMAHCYDDVLAHAQDLERSSTSGAPKWPPIPPTFGGRRETLRPPLSS